jgi:PKD repeat protein
MSGEQKHHLETLSGFLFLCLFVSFLGANLAFANDFRGSWVGTWSSNYSGTGGLSASVSQTGNTLGGTLSLTNTECGNFNNLPLSGYVSGDTASLMASAICSLDGSFNQLNFAQGILVNNNISGNYKIYSDGYFWDSGTFSFNRSINTITASAGTGGTISPSGNVTVSAGSNRAFAFAPSSNYRILDVKVDNVSVGAVSSYTFQSVNANHTIAASFTVVAPIAEFTAQPTTGDFPLTVAFTDQSTGSISTRSWDFGDGNISSSQHPSHTYLRPGVYTVSLAVSGSGGSDSEIKTDYIAVKGATILEPVYLLLLNN